MQFWCFNADPKYLNFATFSKDFLATLIQRVPRTTQSSFPGLDKNMLTGAGGALPGASLADSRWFVCLAYYAVSVLVYFSSAITARAIYLLTSVLFLFLVS
jgi:hypothetical protein